MKRAEISYSKDEYSLAEQALQLYLKYAIAKKYGEFPKTHNLRILLELTDNKELLNLYDENKDTLRDLELAYIAS